jgi:Leucine-rich repeat (LRR) protein
LSHKAAFLDPLELWSFLKSHPAANLDPTMTLRIPDDASDDAVVQMLPSLMKFEKISIGLNHDHLSFLQENCPQLRHLIVYSKDDFIDWHVELKPFMDSLKTFNDLISLKIDIPHYFVITKLEDLGLPTYTILPVFIPYRLTDEAVRRLLPSHQRFEKIRIGLIPGHLAILKECINLRGLSVIQYDADVQIEETIPLIIRHLSSFNRLKGLKIELWSWWDIDLVVDMAPLESLTELTELELIGVDSPDLSFISGLKRLKKLGINQDRALRSIIPIAELPLLDELDLSWNRGFGSDFASILSGMKKLKRLDLQGPGLENVSFLMDMVQLDRLDISNCDVRDISYLSGLPIYVDKQKLIWRDSYGPQSLEPRTV